MKQNDMNRRDFTKLTAAAFGGLVAGSMIGCGKGKEGDAVAATAAKHACRGLNDCKSDKNKCAGQGTCSTATPHECGGHNDCKNQGGCGDTPGANSCKEKGGCAVPITDKDMWKSARAAFEKRMKAADKTFGNAPAA